MISALPSGRWAKFQKVQKLQKVSRLIIPKSKAFSIYFSPTLQT